MAKRTRTKAATLEKAKKNVKIILWIFLIALGSAFLAWLISWIIQVSGDWHILQQDPETPAKQKFDASLEVAKAIVGGLGTLATAVGGGLVLWNILLTQTRLITERFSKAIEQLGSDKLEIRLGGIYALERIAYDSKRDHWTIMEVLASFVQEKAPFDDEILNAKNRDVATEQNQSNETVKLEFLTKDFQVTLIAIGQQAPDGESINLNASDISKKQNRDITLEKNQSSETAKLEFLTKDIQAALTVIGRRDIKQDPDGKIINLNSSNLSGANLSGANFSGANFSNSNLSGANLRNANLENARFIGTYLNSSDLSDSNFSHAQLIGAKLSKAILSHVNFFKADLMKVEFKEAEMDDANLSSANLSKADLSSAKLRGANFTSANLRDADLSDAEFLEADLSDANLTRANLTGADLMNADLSRAKLVYANLSDAKLRYAKNWTHDQLQKAKLCRTYLPEECTLNQDQHCGELDK